jgi:hypothetical protein
MQQKAPDDAELWIEPMQRIDLFVPMRKFVLLERLRISTMGNCHGYVNVVQILLGHAA